MDNLKELTIKDLFLLTKVKEAIQKKVAVAETELPILYGNLFIDYSTSEGLECLKRAIFIQWYAVTEPIENTGVGELNADYQKENLTRVKDLILNKTIDIEFIEMLTHYYSISDWYFNSIVNLNPILDLAFTSKGHIILNEERGIMGEYWKSILFR